MAVARTDGLRANAERTDFGWRIAEFRYKRVAQRRRTFRADEFPESTTVPNEMTHSHYVRLLLMGALSFVSMYVLMYAMVDSLEDVYPNLNQFYMAGLMTAPMMIIEL